MSMNAQFVQVSPDQLTGLIKDPSGIESLFAILPPASLVPPGAMEKLANLVEARRQEVVKRGPQALESTLARLDPKVREAMGKRLGLLGLDPAKLGSPESGEALLKLLKSRAGLKAEASGGAAKGQGAAISIEKSWHGIHYLLCSAAQPTTTLISQAIMGGTDLGEDFSGYGSARFFTVAETSEMATELKDSNLEAQMMARFDPAQMTKVGIYPNQWAGPDAQWLMTEFRHVRDFYAAASAKGFAVLTCLV
jgi:hypothetical protein